MTDDSSLECTFCGNEIEDGEDKGNHPSGAECYGCADFHDQVGEP